MEHYRSVFATTAVMVFGLVTASHVAYPRDPEEDRRPVAAVGTAEPAPTAWVDPPSPRPAQTEAPASPRPAMFTRLAPETVALFSAAQSAAPQRSASAPVRRQRLARLPARLHAAPAAPRTDAGSPAAEAPQPDKAARVDLIGDLIRGLGLGRDS